MTKYERHIRQLCKKHGITIQYAYDSDYAVSAPGKVVWIKENTRSIKLYTTALHEIGHVINEKRFAHRYVHKYIWNNMYSGPYTSKFIMPLEIGAWKTARRLAKWWSPASDRNAVLAIFSYWYGYNDYHKDNYLGISNRTLNMLRRAIEWDKELLSQVATDLFGKA